jgi:hypothetical protein
LNVGFGRSKLRDRRFELWISQGDGTVRGPNGKQMTREEAETLARAAGTSLLVMSKVASQL